MRSLVEPFALIFLVVATSVGIVACASDRPKRTYVDEEELAELLEFYNQGAEDEERVYCWRTAPTGSHIRKTRCATLRQIREEREAVHRRLPTHNIGGGAGP